MRADVNSVRRAFEDMTATGCDVTAPLKWGHFFAHGSLIPLQSLAGALANDGYVIESCDEVDEGTFVLQVSKTEVRTPELLHDVNLEFNRLAEQWRVDLYDGWDAGQP